MLLLVPYLQHIKEIRIGSLVRQVSAIMTDHQRYLIEIHSTGLMYQSSCGQQPVVILIHHHSP